MFAFGAVGGAFTQKDDIFYVMLAQGLLVPALIVLGANIWTTNDNALYTGALGLSNITKVRKRPLVIAAGVIGTVTALWHYDNFISWLNFLNATLPPIGAMFTAFAHTPAPSLTNQPESICPGQPSYSHTMREKSRGMKKLSEKTRKGFNHRLLPSAPGNGSMVR